MKVPWFSGRPVTSMFVGILLVTFYLSFSYGAVAGADVATNESETLEETISDFDSVDDKVAEDIRANHTSPTKEAVLFWNSIATPPSITSAKAGVVSGVHFPTIAEWNGKASHFIVTSALTGLLLNYFRDLIREARS